MNSKIVHLSLQSILSIVFLCIAGVSLAAEEPQGVPTLKVVYFTPKDREAPEDRHERLGRVMKHIQEFYRNEMEARGFGPMTFALEWDAPGKLKIYDVKGKDNQLFYPKGTDEKVLREVDDALKRRINLQNEYVLILGAFVEWKDGIATEYGPYCGNGNFFSGWAFACDDSLIDADLLASKESGGFHYMTGPCSLGKYNTLYIGGIAHEIGHCFGVPHDRELDSQRKTLGVSLMGAGNHHYGEELRDEGKGAFLSEASALLLSACRAFRPNLELQLETEGLRFDLPKLEATWKDGNVALAGRVQPKPASLGIIAYNDNLNIEADYDAKTWVSKPDENGEYHFEITELEKVPYQLRLLFVIPGAAASIDTDYSNLSGTPNLEPINTFFGVNAMKQLLDQKKHDEAERILKEYSEKYPENNKWARKRKHLLTLQSPPKFLSPGKVEESQTRFDLTYAKANEEKVGWYKPSRGILQECGFMEIGGMFFESGIYAHPESCYQFSLEKKWKEFEFAYGLQDGKSGTVVFVVRGDGKELFRSQTVKANELHLRQLNVDGIENLELITEDANDGWANDWGLWIRPTLIR